jgi:DtxR family Mn-dependent transcriptional regulator
MLRFLSERGIAPRDSFEVIDRQPFGGPLFVTFGEREHAIGGGLAAAMRVVLEPPLQGVGVPAEETVIDEHA